MRLSGLLQQRVDAIQADTLVKIGASVGAVAELVLPDAFFWLFVTLTCSNLLDWIFGRHAARARGEFSRTRSRNGLYGKAAQLSILALLRTLEFIVPLTGLPSTMGVLSAAFALGLVIEDIESLERHIITLTGSPVRGLTPVLNRIRAITGGERRGTRPHQDSPVDRRSSSKSTPEEIDREPTDRES